MLTRVARSHVCSACGHDLARLRAPPDPHYALPVVVCPGCALACVRRPYAGTARWRNAVRVWRLGARLFIRVVMLVLLAVLLLASSAGVAGGLDRILGGGPITALLSFDPGQRARLASWLRVEGSWTLPVWVIASVCMGVSCGLAFPHWRLRWWPVGVGAMALAALCIPLVVITPVEWAYEHDHFRDAWRSNEPSWRDLRLLAWPLALAVAMAWATMPTGQRIGRTLHTRRGLRSWRLKRARKRRSQG